MTSRLGLRLGPRTGDGTGNIEADPTIGAGLADRCASCYARGSAGFGGDVATRPDSRDAPHLFDLGLQVLFPEGGWSPTEDLHLTSPAYETGAPLSELEGHVWCRCLDLHQLPAHYQCAAHLDVLQRRIGTHGVSRTLATRLRRAGAEVPSAWV